MQQNFDYAQARFESKEARNKWIVDYEDRNFRNLSDGVTEGIDALFEAQDEYFGPEPSKYTVSHQSGNTIGYTEIGPDGMPMDMHLDIETIDISVEDLLDMF